jgi:hypothetical protein
MNFCWTEILWRRLLCLMAAGGFASCSCAQDTSAEREVQLKAAYVFNFVKFVDWDMRGAADSLDICFDGADDVRDALAQATASKAVGARKILVHAVRSADSLQHCDVVYVDSARPPIPRWNNASALTIGDTQTFTQQGGIIRLYTESNRLRFIINVGNARRAGLTISSNLLKLASQIEQEATL